MSRNLCISLFISVDDIIIVHLIGLLTFKVGIQCICRLDFDN